VSAARFDVQAVVAGGIAPGHATITGTTEDLTAPASRHTFVKDVTTRAPVVTIGLEAGLMISADLRSCFHSIYGPRRAARDSWTASSTVAATSASVMPCRLGSASRRNFSSARRASSRFNASVASSSNTALSIAVAGVPR
jgi:hypothetical protein